MLLKKSLLIITLITCAGGLYVHQKIELIKVGYKIGGGEKEMSLILNENRRLMCKIETLASPSHLDDVLLAHHPELKFPGEDQVRFFARVSEEPEVFNIKSRPIVSIIPPAYAASLEDKLEKRGIFDFFKYYP